jgi:demethylmenaquinone methyltransferase/2-methoxy-6-polyprenyl-1,4-benzoquinol methylase
MFDRACGRYDVLNSLLSLGRDGAWRTALARGLRSGERVLDVCCGSARSAAAAHRQVGAAIVGVDASAAMLRSGQKYTRERLVPFHAVHADAFQLPFPDESFDAVTVAWGLRNLSPEDAALAELTRVLRPGGRLHVLDSPSPGAGLRGSAHRWYLQNVVPRLGRLSPDADAYRYLADTVLSFGDVPAVARRLAEAGLEVEETRELLWGAAALWRARRPTSGEPAIVQTASSKGEIVQPARPRTGKRQR